MPRPIRILHIIDNLDKGGLENGVANLISGMDDGRFENIVYVNRRLGPNAERLPRDRVRVICREKKDTDPAIETLAFRRVIRELKPDVAHSRNWPTMEAVFAGRLTGCAVVHSEHGLDSLTPGTEPRRRLAVRRLAFELAHRIVAVSRGLRDVHASRTGFPAGRIEVIHNGVDNNRFRPDPAARVRARRELGLTESDYCIGCVGNLFPVKDHMTLLQAALSFSGKAAAAGVSGGWRLLIIGEGPERPALEAFVNAHAVLQRNVHFAGSSDRVAELLNGLDVYVLSSITEGICNSLLEAMSTGLPVIATVAGGNPEVVADGNSGLLTPVGDAERLAGNLLTLVADQGLRQRLGQQALRHVQKNFSVDSMVRKYEQLYSGLAAAESGSVPAVAET